MESAAGTPVAGHARPRLAVLEAGVGLGRAAVPWRLSGLPLPGTGASGPARRAGPPGPVRRGRL
ncbi:hypothetical protein, partial [Trebonia sp.]|uniref:hypothetical protein n=1 Tax=Trebonia sp. TaxID=2767075 RepID=UPI002624DB25